MKLLRNGEPFGELANYEFTSPYAQAIVQTDDTEALERLKQASHFVANVLPRLGCDCYTEIGGVSEYDHELAQLGIGEADVDAMTLSRWRVEGVEQSGKISLLTVAHDNSIRWRWIA